MPGMDLEILGDMGDMGAFPPGFVRDNRGYPGAYAHPAYGPRPYAWAQPQYAQYQQPYGWHPHHHHHHHRQMMGYNPQLSMMGHGGAPTWFNYLAGDDAPGGGPPPMGAEQVPLAMVQPAVPGVAQRGGRVQPLGFTPGRFTDTSGANLDVTATPQRPVRGGRLVGTYSRVGTTANGLLFLNSMSVGTDGQLLSSDPIGFDMLAPNSFGVGVNFSPASVGNQLVAQVAISDIPAAEDSVPFSLAIWGLTVG